MISVEDVRNNHLLDIIHQIYNSEGDYIDEDLIDLLCGELKVSTLISPACGAGLLRMPASDDSSVLPVFTSLNECNVEFEGDQFGFVSWNFRIFENLIDDFDDIEGIVVNPHVDNFFISWDIIDRVLDMLPNEFEVGDLKRVFTNEELHEIFESENPELDSYLDNFDGDYKGLFEELSKVNLYVFIATKENILNRVKDGIIDPLDVKSHGIFTANYQGLEANYLFSGSKYMRAVQRFHEKEGWYIFALPTNLTLMADYILDLDLDFLFLNPNDQEIVIPREVLSQNIDLIYKKCSENLTTFMGEYAFQLTKRALRPKRKPQKSFKKKK